MPLFFPIFPGFKMVPSFGRLLWGIGKYHSRNHYLFPYGIRMIIGASADVPATDGGWEVFLWVVSIKNMPHRGESCGRLVFYSSEKSSNCHNCQSGACNSAVSAFPRARICPVHILTHSATGFDSLMQLQHPLLWNVQLLCMFFFVVVPSRSAHWDSNLTRISAE